MESSEQEHPTTISIEEGGQATTVIAEQIEAIAKAAEELRSTRLSHRALVILLQDRIGQSNITRSQIGAVLRALPELRKFLD